MGKLFSFFGSKLFLKILTGLIIIAGITVRVAVYLQNRNLFIDEANLARNIYERGFIGLTQPLIYEQYAPPVFLWVVKCFTLLFGYGEEALRSFALIAGIASLFLLRAILKEIASYRSLWYPVGLMAVAFIMIRYSAELKQYMPDTMVSLGLILLALKTDIEETKSRDFFLIWLLAGSLSIWASMPSVFILAGVGTYYLIIGIQLKSVKKFIPVIAAGAIWMLQFGFYYLTILKPQADSEYLQNFHREYFLFATPSNMAEWQHNWDRISNLLQETGGYSAMALYFNLLMILIAVIYGLKRDTAKMSLVIVPVGLVLVAAALNKYSLIPRVALFMMPLFLLLIGYGMDRVMSIKSAYVYIPVIVIAAISIKNHSMLNMIWNRYEVEEITNAMKFSTEKGIVAGSQLYLHNGARPAFIYYTTIHPDRKKWDKIKDAHLLWWDVNYDTLSRNITQRSAFIFTSVSSEDMEGCKSAIRNYMHCTDSLDKPGAHAFVYERN